MENKETTKQLGEVFTQYLRREIGPQRFTEVVRRNAVEQSPSVCHSHDFIDANEVMAEAFRAVIGREIDLQSDADCALWSDAWAVAKASWTI